jgi:uncharacterized protein DUF5666
MKFRNFPVGLMAILALSAALAMCGKDIKNITGQNTGGGGVVPPPPVTGTPAVSWGVMKKGSVIVNGVQFNTGGAVITHDNSPASDNLLQDGMNVKVRGNVNDDGVTGAASNILTESEVRGAITATAVDSVTVLGQQSFVDSRTVYANVSGGLSALAPGLEVEIHGIRDPLGRLLATRIEVLDVASGPPADRLRGIVEAPFTGGSPPALTFTLRGITVVTVPATLIQPDGATINAGDSVAVHGFLSSGTTFTAGRIDREDLEGAEFEPQESEQFKVEGFVSGFTSLNANFLVGAVTTSVTATTRFESGVSADLVNNVRIEVEGRTVGGVMQANTVKFDDANRFQANADAAGSANVLGRTVVITSRTELAGLAQVADITLGQGLRIRGFTNPDGTVTATLIEGLNKPVDPARIVIQGVVDDVSVSARTVTILGIVIDAGGATDVGLEGQVITLDQFFAQLTAKRTIVKATGTFVPGTPPHLTATGVEIE